MPYNLLTSLIPCVSHILLYIRQVLTVLFFSCTTCIVYQYFKEHLTFVLKAGAKVRGFILTTKCFRKFFFRFSFYIVSQALLRKGKKVKKKSVTPFLCESDCKDKNFKHYLPNFIGSFFVLMVK